MDLSFHPLISPPLLLDNIPSWMAYLSCVYPERAPEPDASDSMMGLLQVKAAV